MQLLDAGWRRHEPRLLTASRIAIDLDRDQYTIEPAL